MAAHTLSQSPLPTLPNTDNHSCLLPCLQRQPVGVAGVTRCQDLCHAAWLRKVMGVVVLYPQEQNFRNGKSR